MNNHILMGKLDISYYGFTFNEVIFAFQLGCMPSH